MRWPWKREPAAEPAPDVAAAAPAVAPADTRPSPMGWAFLPPIQRTLDTPIEPVTRPTAFPADLPAWRSPAFTSTLSHAVVDTAPGGVVDGDGGGLGDPSHTVGPAPELTLLPPPRPTAVQRAVAGPAQVEEPSLTPAGSAAEQPESGGLDVVRPEVPPPALTRAPSVGMPVVHRSVVVDPPPLEPAARPVEPPPPRAEAAPHDLLERAPLGDVDAAMPPAVPVAPPAAGRSPVVQRTADAPPAPTPRLGLGPPLSRPPLTAVPAPPEPRESGEIPRESGEIPVESSEIPVESAGLGRDEAGFAGDDPGFGEDLPRFAEKAAEQGFTEVPIQRAIGPTLPPSPQPTPAPAAAKAPALVDLPAPELTLARTVDPAVEPAPPSSPVSDPVPEPADESAGPGRSAAWSSAGGLVTVASATSSTDEPSAAESVVEPPPALLPSAPLPLAGGIATSIQRADLLPGPGSPTPSLVVQPAPLLPTRPSRERAVPIQRLAIGETTTPPAPAATRRRTASPSAVQRSASPQALAENPLPDAAPRDGDNPDVPLAEVGAPPAPLGVGRPGDVVRSAPPGPVLSRSVEAAPERVPRSGTAPTMVSRSTPSAVPPTMPLAAAPAVPVSVQAAADDEPVASAGADPADGPLPAEGAGAATSAPGDVTVQTAAAPAAPAAAPGKAGGGGSATGDVDALAQKLFPAVLRRMKAELLLDRERRGVRTDPW